MSFKISSPFSPCCCCSFIFFSNFNCSCFSLCICWILSNSANLAMIISGVSSSSTYPTYMDELGFTFDFARAELRTFCAALRLGRFESGGGAFFFLSAPLFLHVLATTASSSFSWFEEDGGGISSAFSVSAILLTRALVRACYEMRQNLSLRVKRRARESPKFSLPRFLKIWNLLP